MNVTADTNVLLRMLLHDDEQQARAAETLLNGADLIAITLHTLCELAWVLRRSYRFNPQQIAQSIRAFAAIPAVQLDHTAVQAGLAILDAGGDFADGVIAHQGAALGGHIFATFDRSAATLLAAHGHPTQLL